MNISSHFEAMDEGEKIYFLKGDNRMKFKMILKEFKMVLWLLFVGTIAYNIVTEFSDFRPSNWYGHYYEVVFPVAAYIFILVWAAFFAMMLGQVFTNRPEKFVKFVVKTNLTIIAIGIGVMVGTSYTTLILVTGMVLTALVVLTIPMAKKLILKKNQ